MNSPIQIQEAISPKQAINILKLNKMGTALLTALFTELPRSTTRRILMKHRTLRGNLIAPPNGYTLFHRLIVETGIDFNVPKLHIK